MKQFKKGIKFIKKISDGVYNFVDGYNEKTLYLFNFEDVKREYAKVLKIYNNQSENINLLEFSKNYSFAYYQKMNLLDYQKDTEAEKMKEEIYSYLKELREKGEI